MARQREGPGQARTIQVHLRRRRACPLHGMGGSARLPAAVPARGHGREHRGGPHVQGEAPDLLHEGPRPGRAPRGLPAIPEVSGDRGERLGALSGAFRGLQALLREVGEQPVQQGCVLRRKHVHHRDEQHQELPAARGPAQGLGVCAVEGGAGLWNEEPPAAVALAAVAANDRPGLRVRRVREVARPGGPGPRRHRAPLPVLPAQRRPRGGPTAAELRDLLHGLSLPLGPSAPDRVRHAEPLHGIRRRGAPVLEADRRPGLPHNYHAPGHRCHTAALQLRPQPARAPAP
mmetsp:Transcript_35033/g.104090  ORF Transcript_35033/g.104090 Transcript_35033/m.104090 type:complete len:289 (-) Transcript_35033:162-1028(-)